MGINGPTGEAPIVISCSPINHSRLSDPSDDANISSISEKVDEFSEAFNIHVNQEFDDKDLRHNVQPHPLSVMKQSESMHTNKMRAKPSSFLTDNNHAIRSPSRMLPPS